MLRWVQEQNLERFRKLLATDADEQSRRTVRSMIIQAERNLALLEAAASGAASPRTAVGPGAQSVGSFRQDFETSDKPYLLLDPGPGLHIVDANAAYAAAAMIDPNRVAGQRMFDVFPDNPDDPFADGVSLLLRSLQIAARTGLCHQMKDQRYDVRDAEGRFVERYWRPRNSVITDHSGRVVFLLHHVEDVTAEIQVRRSLGSIVQPDFDPVS